MKLAIVEFVVQVPDDGDSMDLLEQARRYLCTGGRSVDFIVTGLDRDGALSFDRYGDSPPLPAEYLAEGGGR